MVTSKITEHNGSSENGTKKTTYLPKEKQMEEMRNFFNPQTFPKGFENWTKEEQDDYFEQKMSNYLPKEIPKFLLKICSGICHKIRAGSIPSEIPEWVDTGKLRRGQQFLRKNFLQFSLSIIVGHFVLFTFQSFRQPIDITRNSYTPYTTFLRFYKTMTAVRNMHITDLLTKGTPAYVSAEKARKVHGMLNKMFAEKTVAELNEMCRIKKPWSTAKDVLLEDFREVIPELEVDYRMYVYDYDAPWRPKGINQVTMSISMMCFAGFLLENPKLFGIHNATEQDLDDLSHWIRFVTYYLGVDDKYNFCDQPTPEVQERIRIIVDMCGKQNLREINATWEHMMRCLTVGSSYYVPFISFETYILWTADYLKLPMNNYRASIGFIERARYRIFRFLFDYLMKWSLVSWFLNKVFEYLMNRSMSYGPAKLAELREHSQKTLLAASVIV